MQEVKNQAPTKIELALAGLIRQHEALKGVASSLLSSGKWELAITTLTQIISLEETLRFGQGLMHQFSAPVVPEKSAPPEKKEELSAPL